MLSLSRDELEMYARHLSLDNVGSTGQLLLKQARVLVVGAGGLGCPVLSYLTAAGVGTIGIVDHDRVDKSNLQRQVLFSFGDVGQFKATVAARRLAQMNPFVNINPICERLSVDNALKLITNHDIIIDATDNFQAKFLINDACYFASKPLVYASINQFEGQLSVFYASGDNGEPGPNYRDLLGEPPPPHLSQNCAEAGVIGVLPGLIGCLQANEAIKLILGIGQPLIGKLLTADALSLQFSIFTLKKRRDNPLSGKTPSMHRLEEIRYSCELPPQDSISVGELWRRLQAGENVQLIDVREPYEREISSIGGVLIPLASLNDSITNIDLQRFTVVYCKSGKRSWTALQALKPRFGAGKCFALEGGIDAVLRSSYANILRRGLA